MQYELGKHQVFISTYTRMGGGLGKLAPMSGDLSEKEAAIWTEYR